jgi:sugar phosphate isomerase/epimerase
MYVSLNGVTISNRAPWPEFAHLAQRVGYGGVDITLGKALDEGVDSTRALLKELKLKRLDRAAQFLKAIGCPRMVTWIMPSSDTPKTELRKIYKDRFTAISEVLRPTGVRLGLEFVGPLQSRKRAPHEFIWRMDEMLAFAQECGPNLGLLLDSWHWHHAGATPADIVAAGKRGIVHVHLADAPKLPPEEIRDNERLIPGEGVIDWNGFFGALRKIGYEDGLSPEIFGRGLKDMPAEEAARLALQGSLAVMRKAGVT